MSAVITLSLQQAYESHDQVLRRLYMFGLKNVCKYQTVISMGKQCVLQSSKYGSNIAGILCNNLKNMPMVKYIPYILEYNLHPFCSFRGLKNWMWIIFAVESWILKKWYSRCTCRNNTIQSFIILFITVVARGGRSTDVTTNGTRKHLGTIPSW
jgi:hypothetical protein